MEARIRQLTQLLETATVGETPADDGVVEPGMVVTVDMFGDEETFLLGSPRDHRRLDLEVFTEKSPLGAPSTARRSATPRPTRPRTARSSRSRSSRPRRTCPDRPAARSASTAASPTGRRPSCRAAPLRVRHRSAAGRAAVLRSWPAARRPPGSATAQSSGVGDRVLQRPRGRRRRVRTGMLPNSLRAAWVTADTGFHSANVCSGAGQVLERHERVGDEGQREDHDERGVVDHLGARHRAARPRP